MSSLDGLSNETGDFTRSQPQSHTTQSCVVIIQNCVLLYTILCRWRVESTHKLCTSNTILCIYYTICVPGTQFVWTVHNIVQILSQMYTKQCVLFNTILCRKYTIVCISTQWCVLSTQYCVEKYTMFCVHSAQNLHNIVY